MDDTFELRWDPRKLTVNESRRAKANWHKAFKRIYDLRGQMGAGVLYDKEVGRIDRGFYTREMANLIRAGHNHFHPWYYVRWPYYTARRTGTYILKATGYYYFRNGVNVPEKQKHEVFIHPINFRRIIFSRDNKRWTFA